MVLVGQYLVGGKNNKFITKVVYRYPDGSRNSILLDLNWASDNSKKMTEII